MSGPISITPVGQEPPPNYSEVHLFAPEDVAPLLPLCEAAETGQSNAMMGIGMVLTFDPADVTCPACLELIHA